MTEHFAIKTQEQNGSGSKSATSATKPKTTPSDKAIPQSNTDDKTESKDEKSGVKKALDKGLSIFKKKK